MPFTGRGRADDHPNYGKRPAAAVQCSGGLSRGRTAVAKRTSDKNAATRIGSHTGEKGGLWSDIGVLTRLAASRDEEE